MSGEAKVWGKRRVTLPLRVTETAGIAIGDRLRLRADGDGRVIIDRIEAPHVIGVDEPTSAQPELPAV